jgi:hypothetical protein
MLRISCSVNRTFDLILITELGSDMNSPDTKPNPTRNRRTGIVPTVQYYSFRTQVGEFDADHVQNYSLVFTTLCCFK